MISQIQLQRIIGFVLINRNDLVLTGIGVLKQDKNSTLINYNLEVLVQKFFYDAKLNL